MLVLTTENRLSQIGPFTLVVMLRENLWIQRHHAHRQFDPILAEIACNANCVASQMLSVSGRMCTWCKYRQDLYLARYKPYQGLNLAKYKAKNKP